MADITHSSDKETIPFYPDHVRTEFRVVVGVTVVVVLFGLLGLFAPVGLGQPADPMDTPAHIKPEWYFLALYQLLKFIDKNVGATLPVIAIGLLALWPFLDRKPDTSPKVRRIRFISAAVAVVLLIAMTIWGEIS
jgi:quinol-cytochrome oxidoreductase complex cytochrome b subunit